MDTATDLLFFYPLGHVSFALWQASEIEAMSLLRASTVAATLDNNEKQKLLWALTTISILTKREHS